MPAGSCKLGVALGPKGIEIVVFFEDDEALSVYLTPDEAVEFASALQGCADSITASDLDQAMEGIDLKVSRGTEEG